MFVYYVMAMAHCVLCSCISLFFKLKLKINYKKWHQFCVQMVAMTTATSKMDNTQGKTKRRAHEMGQKSRNNRFVKAIIKCFSIFICSFLLLAALFDNFALEVSLSEETTISFFSHFFFCFVCCSFFTLCFLFHSMGICLMLSFRFN